LVSVDRSLETKCTGQLLFREISDLNSYLPKTGHLPKHLITEEVRAEVRNVIPADPPGKYDIA
jgi:hypothetical protein